MSRFVFLLSCAFILIGSGAHARVVKHTFNVGNHTVRLLCQNRVITAVNKKFPGPTIKAHEGDTVIVHVNNYSPYDITIHWHGVFQRLSAWADGPNYITQCPIVPGNSYTYKFNITGQEGTLWWHAHVSFLRATVYGAIIVLPRAGTKAYPFPRPFKEVPILLGEWWNANVVDVENEALRSGGLPNISDAFTINGKPGDLIRCSDKRKWWNAKVVDVQNEALQSGCLPNISDAFTINGRPDNNISCFDINTYTLVVVPGMTYLLRIINAAINNQLFFKIAGHKLTVIGIDATYTTPYPTDVIVIAPGQTVNALMVANAPPARYYMAASAYISTPNTTFDNTTATGIVHYVLALPIPPVTTPMPPFDDTDTAHKFYTSLTSLVKPVVPTHIDEHMFVTFGLGLAPCRADQPECNGVGIVASMNSVSMVFPTEISLLEAHFRGMKGVYRSDFPNRPPVKFDYTDADVNYDPALSWLRFPERSTRLKKLKYNATVELVLQDTAILGIENHPIHLHGYNFFVLAQGFGNFEERAAAKSYNLVNPQQRNTIAVPTGGWAVIRFTANNPGVWVMHCHLDVHLPLGLAMAFEVENGPTPDSTLPPPPPDFPRCQKKHLVPQNVSDTYITKNPIIKDEETSLKV